MLKSRTLFQRFAASIVFVAVGRKRNQLVSYGATPTSLIVVRACKIFQHL